MPTPDRTSLDAIVAAGRDLLESDGARRAHHAGGRRPGRRARAVALQAGAQPATSSSRASPRPPSASSARGSTPRPTRTAARTRRDLVASPAPFRAFAHERPAGYRLFFGPGASSASPTLHSRMRAAPCSRRRRAGRRPSTGSTRPARSRPGPTASSAWSSQARSGSAAMSTAPSSSASHASPSALAAPRPDGASRTTCGFS